MPTSVLEIPILVVQLANAINQLSSSPELEEPGIKELLTQLKKATEAEEALKIGGALGFTKTQILRIALVMFVKDPVLQDLKNDFIASESEKQEVDKSEIVSRILKAYEKVVKERKSHFTRDKDEDR